MLFIFALIIDRCMYAMMRIIADSRIVSVGVGKIASAPVNLIAGALQQASANFRSRPLPEACLSSRVQIVERGHLRWRWTWLYLDKNRLRGRRLSEAGRTSVERHDVWITMLFEARLPWLFGVIPSARRNLRYSRV